MLLMINDDLLGLVRDQLSVTDLLSFVAVCRRTHALPPAVGLWSAAVTALSLNFAYDPAECDYPRGIGSEWRLANDPRLSASWKTRSARSQFIELFAFVRSKLLQPMRQYALDMMEDNDWFETPDGWTFNNDTNGVTKSHLYAIYTDDARRDTLSLLTYLNYFESQVRGAWGPAYDIESIIDGSDPVWPGGSSGRDGLNGTFFADLDGPVGMRAGSDHHLALLARGTPLEKEELFGAKISRMLRILPGEYLEGLAKTWGVDEAECRRRLDNLDELDLVIKNEHGAEVAEIVRELAGTFGWRVFHNDEIKYV